MRNPDESSHSAFDVPLLSRPSVRGVPQLHGSMTLVERHRTIYFRAESSNVAEQERYNKVDICCARCDVAAEHEDSRCASSHHLPRSPALSAPSVPTSQVTGELRCRCATDFNLLTSYAQNVGTSSSREALLQLDSARACRWTRPEGRRIMRLRRPQCSGRA